MKRAMLAAALISAAAVPTTAGGRGQVTGAYVEARTAEVFTGGCIMNSEAETMGKQALLAWKVDRGTFNGVAIDGLAVIAALAGDRNLGMTEMGGAKPAVRSALYVDARANGAQQLALVAMANELSNGLVGSIINVTPTPIRFADRGAEIEVVAGAGSEIALGISKHIPHDPTCGAMQWFHPFAAVDEVSMGMTERHAFAGSGLGTKWSDPNRRSSFFGTFTY